MLLRALVSGAVVFGIAVPAMAIALWRVAGNRTKAFTTIGAVAVVILLDEIALHVPRLGVFHRLQWNWQGKILEVCLSILVIVVFSMATDEAAVTRPRPHWLRPTLLSATAIFLLPIAFFLAAHAREALTLEGWGFQLTLPGLAEELLFRGVIQGLLNRGLGKRWQLLGADIGWGWLITSILFAAGHVVSVDRQLRIELDWVEGVGPLIGSLIGGWLREKISSVWPVVVLHNISNLLIAGLTLLFRK